ncbi:TPA: hypothetical protein DCX15_00230 [bacterium]|nr:hypothetical protein [bacterium]
MTRINLLSKEVITKRRVKKGVLLGALLAGMVIFFAVTFYSAKVAQRENLKREIAAADEEIAKYKALEVQLEEVKKEKADIERRLGVIKQLIEKDRQLWAHLLDEMSRCIPGGVWLESIDDTGGDELQISAVALDNFAVAQYMVSLMQNIFFGEVELKDLEKVVITNYDVRNIQLSCRYRRGAGV